MAEVDFDAGVGGNRAGFVTGERAENFEFVADLVGPAGFFSFGLVGFRIGEAANEAEVIYGVWFERFFRSDFIFAGFGFGNG